MLRKLNILLILAALGLSATPASALFDQTVVNPRGRAMGETGVSVQDDAFAAFINPGQLGGTDHGAAAVTYVQPFGADFTDFFYAGAALPVHPKYGNLGVGLSHFKVEYEGTKLLQETQLTLAHGFNLWTDIHSRVDFGWALNLYSAELGESVSGIDPGNATAFGVDLGMSVTVHRRTQIGFQVKNVNNPMIGVDEEELRRRLVAGAAYQPYEGVTTTFEIENELGEDVRYHGGLEMFLVEGFALRAGVLTNPNRLTAGFGYTHSNFGVNYGFSTGGGVLDATHQFGLHFAWGGEAQ
ncbi:hypothetical protein KDM41_08850 [bacterium]|nr:hypothetical protein [bacterium]